MAERFAISGFQADGSSTAIQQYSAVAYSTVDTVAAMGAANARALGFIQELIDGTAAESCSVVQFGETFVVAGAAFSVGDLLNVNGTAGRVKEAKAAIAAYGAVANAIVTWTAKDAWQGERGDLITIEYRDPSANSQSLGIVLEGNAIIVNLKTNTSGTIESTATEVIAAVAGLATTAAMVIGTDSGTSNGSGVVAAVAATRLSGGGNVCAFAMEAATAAGDIVKAFALQTM